MFLFGPEIVIGDVAAQSPAFGLLGWYGYVTLARDTCVYLKGILLSELYRWWQFFADFFVFLGYSLPDVMLEWAWPAYIPSMAFLDLFS